MAYTTIDDPSAHFQVATWSGNNSNQAITNDGNSDLQPDLVWIKARNESSDHALLDSTRGLSARLHSNTDDVETSDSSATMSSFDSDGFTMTQYNVANDANDTGVAWQWKANGGTRTTNTESGNNPGGGYQANTTAGFSIVDYTGTGASGTMAHGLGKVPTLIMIKKRTDDTESWRVYHQFGYKGDSYGQQQSGGRLDTNNAFDHGANSYWDNTNFTTSVFTIKDNSTVNDDGDTYIAYCFAEIQGYSKFGYYMGNANVDGPFIYLGFKPKYFLLKCVDATQNWYVFDTARDTHNPSNSAIKASGDSAQETGYAMDFVSNGFKIRHDDGAWNGSGKDFVYIAFAEHPFVSSEGVPVTAR